MTKEIQSTSATFEVLGERSDEGFCYMIRITIYQWLENPRFIMSQLQNKLIVLFSYIRSTSASILKELPLCITQIRRHISFNWQMIWKHSPFSRMKIDKKKKSRHWVEWHKIGLIYNNSLLWERKDVNMYVYILSVELQFFLECFRP